MYSDLKGRVLGAVPPDMARTVASSLRSVARELRGSTPGGNREAVSLSRMADELDEHAFRDVLSQNDEDDELLELERVAQYLERGPGESDL